MEGITISISFSTNPYSVFDADIKKELGSKSILAFISKQEKRYKDVGKEIPEQLRYAKKAHISRSKQKEFKNKGKPSFYQDLPSDHKQRVFISKDQYKLFGKKLKQTIVKFAKDINPNKKITFSYMNMAQYFSQLAKNEKIPQTVKKALVELEDYHTNQGPGLGPTNERRAALALAILQDQGLIKGFHIFGEAGKPMKLMHDLEPGREKINYAHHEEAMAVDILVELYSKSGNLYFPLQIKSSGSFGYDDAVRYLTFNKDEKQRVSSVVPEAKKYFVQDALNENKYRLKLKRKVMKIALSNRKLVKNHKKDLDPDIVNKIMTMIEYAHGNGEALLLKHPYQKYSYADKVISMIKNGFLTPIEDFGQELNQPAYLLPPNPEAPAIGALAL